MDHAVATTNHYARGIADFVSSLRYENMVQGFELDDAHRVSGRMSAIEANPDAVSALLVDPETSFTVEPKGIMQYGDTLAHTDQIKDFPEAWTEMFVPQMHGRSGS